MKRVTYFLGAGASYNSLPILDRMSQEMINLSNECIRKLKPLDNSIIDFKLKPYDVAVDIQPFYQIGYFGLKGQEFNTIDTYAKKLFLLKENRELAMLKTSISLFFALWPKYKESVKDTSYLIGNVPFNGLYSEEIDRRYISLLATILNVSSDRKFPVFPENVNFITWNYDLQVESAYGMFCGQTDNFDKIDQKLNFTFNKSTDCKVCHLNGFHGYYNFDETPGNLLDKRNNTDLAGYLKKLEFIIEDKNMFDFHDYINYSWDTNNDRSVKARSIAEKILSETDYLVIIGYSFPNFNREIDRMLFNSLKHKVKIIYQDPNASVETLLRIHDRVEVKTATVITNPSYFEYPI